MKERRNSMPNYMTQRPPPVMRLFGTFSMNCIIKSFPREKNCAIWLSPKHYQNINLKPNISISGILVTSSFKSYNPETQEKEVALTVFGLGSKMRVIKALAPAENHGGHEKSATWIYEPSKLMHRSELDRSMRSTPQQIYSKLLKAIQDRDGVWSTIARIKNAHCTSLM